MKKFMVLCAFAFVPLVGCEKKSETMGMPPSPPGGMQKDKEKKAAPAAPAAAEKPAAAPAAPAAPAK